jgi:toluene monooxygenase system protein E
VDSNEGAAMTVRRRHAPTLSARRTYSHLEALRKVPDDYDIATSRLLYYVDRGFSVKATTSSWYERYQRGACLSCPDWDAFVDPRRTTYSKYVALQRAREAQADGLVHALSQTGYAQRLPEQWVQILGRTLGPLCYPIHGLSMVASYIGSMAPAGRIVIAALFQSADEMRRIQRLTQRVVLLKKDDPRFSEDARGAWQNAPEWQPLRALVERLLVTYDWAEAFVALNVCVKPLIDRVVTDGVGGEALSSGDALLGGLLQNLGEDAAWQRDYTRALLAHATLHAPENKAVVNRLVNDWLPRAAAAVAPLAFALGSDAPAVLERARAQTAKDAGAIVGPELLS